MYALAMVTAATLTNLLMCLNTGKNLLLGQVTKFSDPQTVGAASQAARPDQDSAGCKVPQPVKGLELTPDALLKSIDDGDSVLVSSLLAAGVDANSKDKRGLTAIMIASGVQLSDHAIGGGYSQTKRSSRAALEIVRALARYGADVQAEDRIGITALHVAAAAGNLDIAEMLIDFGADVNKGDRNGTTPLMEAALCNEQTLVLKFLLERGANINAKGANASSALVYSAAAGHPDVFRFLIADGADVSAGDAGGPGALMEAASHGHAEIVEILLDLGVPVNGQNERGYTALMFAAFNGREGAIKTLLRRGARKDLVNGLGETASSIAAARNFADAVKLLE